MGCDFLFKLGLREFVLGGHRDLQVLFLLGSA